MPSKPLNRSLHAAKATKQDEFYTQLSDIEKELRHYTKYFKGKTVLCNCDDPKVSNFFHFFSHNFEKLKLKKLITTCYKNCEPDLFSQHTAESGIYLEYGGDKNNNRVPDPEEIGIHKLKGDGDFRSEECVKLLKEADIVVTNPPFSLFREYLEQLMKYKKKFLIIGNKNTITYKEPFTLIKQNRLWVGVTPMGTDMTFRVSEALGKELVKTKKHGSAYRIQNGVVVARAQACWFTNLEHQKRHEELVLYKTYNPKEFPTYDNYDAIEVSKTNDIPMDYTEAMGVPITFLDKYNPDQFEILGQTDRDNSSGLRTKVYTQEDVSNPNDLNRAAVIRTGHAYKAVYMRIVIKRKP
ncbi:MAG: adenine-specific methyltransferase EcoRI family protein [Kiritimatiellia bacterium]